MAEKSEVSKKKTNSLVAGENWVQDAKTYIENCVLDAGLGVKLLPGMPVRHQLDPVSQPPASRPNQRLSNHGQIPCLGTFGRLWSKCSPIETDRFCTSESEVGFL